MPDYETTPEYRAWVEASRTPTAEDKAEYPPPEEVMEQRKKKPAGRNRQAELGVSR